MEDIFHMINDTGRLSALKKAGDLSGFALSAHQSNLLSNEVEFWQWMARNYHGSGIFDSPSSMLGYISQGSAKEQWLSRTVQGKGYEWDYMTAQRGSITNLFEVFEAGDVPNRMGSDITQRNLLTGESTESQLKAYTSRNAPDLHNTSTDIRVVTNAEKTVAVQRKGYEADTFQDKAVCQLLIGIVHFFDAFPTAIQTREYLSQVVEIPADEAGRIYLEFGTLRGNFMADIILAMMDDYHFLPDMARKVKNKPAMIADVMEAGRLDEGVTLSTCEIYDDFINSKIDAVNGLVQIEIPNEDTETPEATTQVPEQDSPETLYELGNKYYYGNEVEQDYEQALDYYRKAAEQGYAPAQNALGYMFEHGKGVEKDYAHNNYKQAFVWYKKAAELGVPKNQKKAASLYRKAAAQGDEYAEIQLNDTEFWDYGVAP